MSGLIKFGLPPTFPKEMVPEKAAQLVKDSKKGMSKTALIKLAKDRGFSPTWKPLSHIGDNVFGLGLTVDGLAVPFMVLMGA